MKKVVILRYGEIHLKGKNRGTFENMLLQNLRHALEGIECKVSRIAGRYLVSEFEQEHIKKITDICKNVFGFVSLSVAYEVESDKEVIENAVLKQIADIDDGKEKAFKVLTKRADKNFPVRSDIFSADMGGVILEKYPNFKVDVKNPEIEIRIDIRESGKTYISSSVIQCVGGMPVGSAGKGLLMLSGGIDSPVAGYMMAKRGMKISAVHFHSYPYTSELAKEKVVSLARILTKYNGPIKLHLVSFTKIQEEIHKNCDDAYMINIIRRIMMRVCERLCESEGYKAILTGESLGQVASQTVESITTTNNVVKNIPVLRPLVAFDKTEIIKISKEIGAFETSILPYEDCCTVFLPDSPIIKPTIKQSEKQEKYIDVEGLVNEAIAGAEYVIISHRS
ncbi:MAG: tRNA 4-thiouridine(8) synthase ThiI [Clostridia bacterium]|nr:tRNA 4-thiouridine(8) synthase ThiI [Clostridia bacterium]